MRLTRAWPSVLRRRRPRRSTMGPTAVDSRCRCLLATPLGEEADVIAELLGGFAARIDSAADFAERNRVLLIEASNKVNLDVALAWTPFEERMVERATPFAFTPDVNLPIVRRRPNRCQGVR